MIFADSHTHFYFEDYKDDLQESFNRALNNGVKYMLIPGVDSHTIEPILRLCRRFPGHCFPAIGLHPTDVKENYKNELQILLESVEKNNYYAIGETGLDLYWDKTFLQQTEAFEIQINLAKSKQLPLIIHSRNAFEETMRSLNAQKSDDLKGVFHCFTGSIEQAKRIIDLGFYLGIGGVVTFKNSKLWEVIKVVDLDHIVLETDAPFIAPHPYREFIEKRGEGIHHLAWCVTDGVANALEEVAEKTTQNTVSLFKLPQL